MVRPSPRLRRALLAAALGSMMLPAAGAQDRITELTKEYSQTRDAVRRAKLLPKLGDLQFEQARKELDAGNYAQALRVMQAYRDEARSATAALKATSVNAERRPGGFKQLQIHVRKGVRELDQTLMALPDSQREPFETLRKDLLAIEKELIDLLFPRQPEKLPAREKPKG